MWTDLTTSKLHQTILSKVQKVVSQKEESAQHITLKKVFPDQDMDDIIQQLPVFEKSFIGGSFYFYPPKVLGLGKNKAAIQKLCRANPFLDLQKLHQNLHNSSFTVNDKTYSTLLQVALENTSSEIFPTVEAFDKWWKEQVEPYRNLYLLLADREYLKMTETWTTPLLFQNKQAQINSSYNITTNDVNLQHSPIYNNNTIHTNNARETALSNMTDLSTLERMLPLSAEQGLFEQNKENARYSDSSYLLPPDEIIHGETETEDINREESYSFSFSKGLLQNIYQEMNYWVDIVATLTQNSSDQKIAIEYLIQFIQLFDFPSEYWETLYANSLSNEAIDFLLLKPTQMTNVSRQKYIEWIHQFLKPQTDTSYLQESIMICELDEDQKVLNELNNFQRAHLYLHIAACLMNVDMAVLTEKQKAAQIAMNVHDSLNTAEFTTTQDKQIGFFYDSKTQTLNQQLLNYIFITLKDLLLEASIYMDMVYAVSKNKDIKEATQAPSHLIH